jgi:Ni/Fe-hydrogenase subunit HybB-like protein
VSSDFAIGLTPGWHSTIFPPYFVAGAIFSGFAMVLTLIIPTRAVFKMHNIITMRHLEACAKLVLVTGLMVSYGYLTEYFIAWYSADTFEIYQFFVARATGPAAVVFWVMVVCNVVLPLLFWSKRMRTNIWVLFVVSILINVGMWAERFVIIVMSLQREFLPSGWAAFRPTWVDISIFVGTLSFFALLFLIFLRVLPFVTVWEVKELGHELEHEEAHRREARGA